jgi:hypothetical protein
MGAFGSDSNSTSIDDNADRRNTATEGGIAFSVEKAGKGSEIIAPYGTSYRLGKGAQLVISNNITDGGAQAQASSLLRDVVNSQANLSAGAVRQLADLGTTNVTGGANLSQKTTIIAVIVLGAIIGLAILIFRR